MAEWCTYLWFYFWKYTLVLVFRHFPHTVNWWKCEFIQTFFSSEFSFHFSSTSHINKPYLYFLPVCIYQNIHSKHDSRFKVRERFKTTHCQSSVFCPCYKVLQFIDPSISGDYRISTNSYAGFYLLGVFCVISPEPLKQSSARLHDIKADWGCLSLRMLISEDVRSWSGWVFVVGESFSVAL